MKSLKMCFLFLAFVLIILQAQSPCSAYPFSLGEPSDETIDFKPMEQYLEVKLISINFPEIAEPPWYKEIFLHRKNFGLGYLDSIGISFFRAAKPRSIKLQSNFIT
jgi:hypothetical protein